MRIAICEDDLKLGKYLIDIIQNKTSHSVNYYSSGDQFWFEYQEFNNPFDLVIMDIEFPGELNGIDTAKKIRTLGDAIEIIIISSYDKYALKGYEIHPYGYLLKPIIEHKLLEYINQINSQIELECKSSLIFHNKGGLLKILFNKIIYMESVLHYVNIYTYDNTYKIMAKLSEIHEQCDDRFLIPHKSYIVNVDKISEIVNGYKLIVLENNTTIPISKHRRNDFIKAISTYDIRYYKTSKG